MRYKARGTIDVEVIRRIVRVVGVGQYVRVRTKDGRQARARIGRFDAMQLTLQPEKDGGPFQASYAEIVEIRPEPRSPAARRTAIIAGIGGAAAAIGLLLFSMAYCYNEGC